jgi:hypothetical protein
MSVYSAYKPWFRFPLFLVIPAEATGVIVLARFQLQFNVVWKRVPKLLTSLDLYTWLFSYGRLVMQQLSAASMYYPSTELREIIKNVQTSA